MEKLAEGIRTSGADHEGITEIKGTPVFLDHLPGGRRLVICGAGHVALCVIRLGVMLGYEVTVIEDREEFAEKAREAGAQQVICKPFGAALDGIAGDPETAFVIMTREHAHDVECLRRILKKSCAYVGMMGSRSRTERVRSILAEHGIPEERISQLHAPIGLKIGAATPEEIAVSIVSQILQETSEGKGKGCAFPKELLDAVLALYGVSGCPSEDDRGPASDDAAGKAGDACGERGRE